MKTIEEGRGSKASPTQTIYQIQNTKGEWSDLRPDEVELYVNSNAVTRVKPVNGQHPTLPKK